MPDLPGRHAQRVPRADLALDERRTGPAARRAGRRHARRAGGGRALARPGGRGGALLAHRAAAGHRPRVARVLARRGRRHPRGGDGSAQRRTAAAALGPQDRGRPPLHGAALHPVRRRLRLLAGGLAVGRHAGGVAERRHRAQAHFQGLLHLPAGPGRARLAGRAQRQRGADAAVPADDRLHRPGDLLHQLHAGAAAGPVRRTGHEGVAPGTGGGPGGRPARPPPPATP